MSKKNILCICNVGSNETTWKMLVAPYSFQPCKELYHFRECCSFRFVLTMIWPPLRLHPFTKSFASCHQLRCFVGRPTLGFVSCGHGSKTGIMLNNYLHLPYLCQPLLNSENHRNDAVATPEVPFYFGLQKFQQIYGFYYQNLWTLKSIASQLEFYNMFESRKVLNYSETTVFHYIEN